jgi:hypothetical protein
VCDIAGGFAVVGECDIFLDWYDNFIGTMRGVELSMVGQLAGELLKRRCPRLPAVF